MNYVHGICLLFTIPIHSCVDDGSSAHREKRKKEWLLVSQVLQRETHLSGSVCDIIAIYALQTFFNVIVAHSKYDVLWIHEPTLKSVRVPDAYYVLRVKEVSNKMCFPYFSTIEDITRGDRKGTARWLKKYTYYPSNKLCFCYYVDFKCTQLIADDVELFDLPVEDELQTRRIYRWVGNPYEYIPERHI